jgi:hypothetical protein
MIRFFEILLFPANKQSGTIKARREWQGNAVLLKPTSVILLEFLFVLSVGYTEM